MIRGLQNGFLACGQEPGKSKVVWGSASVRPKYLPHSVGLVLQYKSLFEATDCYSVTRLCRVWLYSATALRRCGPRNATESFQATYHLETMRWLTSIQPLSVQENSMRKSSTPSLRRSSTNQWSTNIDDAQNDKSSTNPSLLDCSEVTIFLIFTSA